jgi:hypothetical protein
VCCQIDELDFVALARGTFHTDRQELVDRVIKSHLAVVDHVLQY